VSLYIAYTACTNLYLDTFFVMNKFIEALPEKI